MTRWYGSLQNRIEENAKSPKPEIGMGVTAYYWSDRLPYEVIAIKDDRHITVRALDHKRIDDNGFSECQEYEYFSNPNGHVLNLFLTKKGVWREQFGRRLGSTIYGLGRAEYYYDFTF